LSPLTDGARFLKCAGEKVVDYSKAAAW
jgi:hypothetical protein